jgi:RND family efflux transporter MFP subunit
MGPTRALPNGKAIATPIAAAIARSAVLAVLALVAACSPDDRAPDAEETPAIPVRVVAPVMRTALPPIELTGTLGAKEEIPLAFKLGGVVARVNAEVGATVREGTVLAELSLTEIASQVSAAREGRDKAQRDLTRARALYADSVATLAQVEDASTQLEVAEAQLRAAEFNRQYAVIRAPAAGVIQRRQVEAGQLVAPGVPVFVLRTDRRGLVLRAAAADRDAVRLAVGDRATVRFDAWPGDSFGARVENVGVAASPQTGTYEVELSVDPASRPLTAGLIGRASVTVRSREAMAFVPATALIEVDGEWASIFVVAPDGATVRRLRVRVAFLDGGMAALAGGERDTAMRVVTAGASRLRDGDRVTVASDVP